MADNTEANTSTLPTGDLVQLRSEKGFSHPESPDSEDCPAPDSQEDTMTALCAEELTSTSSPPLGDDDEKNVMLRAEYPLDNRFLRMVKENGSLRLKMDFVSPAQQDSTVFKRLRQFSEKRLEFVYVFTSVLFDKSIGVKSEGGIPHFSFLDPPSGPVEENDPRVFLRRFSQRGYTILKSLHVADTCLCYKLDSIDSEVTLCKEGTPFRVFSAPGLDEVDHVDFSSPAPHANDLDDSH